MKKIKTRREEIYNLSVAAYLTAFALLLFIFEAYLPPIIPFVPFAKLGLSNIAIIVAFAAAGIKCALIVLFGKCLIGAVFMGNLFSIVYSLPAGIASFLFLIFIYGTCRKFLNIAVISVLCAIIHNIVQMLISSFIIKNFLIMGYLPFAIIVSCVGGVVVALTAKYILIKVFKGECKHAL